MVDSVELAGDVVAGATALAGLILVYIGAVSTSYSTYQKPEQAAVRGRYQTRAWLAVVGLILSILAAGLALIGKWTNIPCIAASAIVLLLAALIWGGGVGIAVAREIK